MKTKRILSTIILTMGILFAGCQTSTPKAEPCPLEDGEYLANFDTDSTMFHVNEANEGKGILSVTDGKMTIHVSLASKGIVNLYPGLAKDAEKDGAVLLVPSADVVVYKDGTADEVYGYDIPVPYLDKEFDVALIGKKGIWYDHKVSVSEPVPYEREKTYETEEAQSQEQPQESAANEPMNGEFTANVTLSGGSGKATVESPCKIEFIDGKAYATIVWSSKNYDYMIVDGEKIMNQSTDGEPSSFVIPVTEFDVELPVIADTVAMGNPHEIEYTLLFELITNTSWNDLDWHKAVDTAYANQFSIEEAGVYKLITIASSGRFLLVNESAAVPDGLPEDVVVIRTPLKAAYLASSVSFDHVSKIDCLNQVGFSGTKPEDLCIEPAKKHMEKGEIAYAGKYSAPDYELLLSKKCDLAIENTMIFHKPEVKEKLEELGVPVLVERSSYESHPFGRMEWIYVYGELFGKTEEAKRFIEEQQALAKSIKDPVASDKTVAFFHVNSNGVVTVRKTNDYIVKLIEMAGGEYALKSTLKDEENALSTMNIQMEDFYLAARNADIIIYNSTIVGELKNVDELISKNALFSDFKAVKDGEVYCTSADFFQEPTGMVQLLLDLKSVISGENGTYKYLKKL